MTAPQTPAEARRLVAAFLGDHDPAGPDALAFLQARFDAGLARPSWPEGLGGLGASSALNGPVDDAFAAAGAPDNRPHSNIIGLGMAAPTLLAFGTPEQQARWLRPLWTHEDVWCQLFSEPGAGSDLAAVATSAVRDGGDWVVNGQKVWTSLAHESRWALLLARTDPRAPKHRGLTYFVCDMDAPGVDVRPLRQLTGETEFNEVFLDGVRIPDDQRIGDVGAGWRVTQATLMNERVAIGGATPPREGGPIGTLAQHWREHPEDRTAGVHDEVLRLWVDAEALRLTSARLTQQLLAGQPGPEGSGAKLAYAQLAQRASAAELAVLGGEALRYDDWTARRPVVGDLAERTPGFRFLRAKANSIEGGTSEVLRNIIAERVLGLPGEPRTDRDTPWEDLPR
ncbi:MAG: putative acyl-CoA dehydrogenase [Klenkia sp.]|nr:putative acyl-CoA dehydrogenase [Klenkia sp.]